MSIAQHRASPVAQRPHDGGNASCSSAMLKRFSGHFATGVSVITAIDSSGKRYGTTLNAVSSLSLDPPLYLACFDNASNTLAAVLQARRFGINLLRREQADLCARFAGRGADKFADRHCRWSEDGTPLLKGALATAVCSVEQVHPGGDHRIVVGRVETCSTHGGDPLLYYCGQLFDTQLPGGATA